jgi:hypothetical protein
MEEPVLCTNINQENECVIKKYERGFSSEKE